jgi:hypothetical protein
MRLPLMGSYVAPHVGEEFAGVGARGFDQECAAGRAPAAMGHEETLTKNLRISAQTVQ